MHENHPNIVVDYIQGGCTGVHQPCDVGIQRPLKISMQKSYHEDIVNEFISQLEEGNKAPKLNDTLGVLCDRSVRWMWNTFNVINKKELV